MNGYLHKDKAGEEKGNSRLLNTENDANYPDVIPKHQYIGDDDYSDTDQEDQTAEFSLDLTGIGRKDRITIISKREFRRKRRGPHRPLGSIIIVMIILIVGALAYYYITEYMPNYKMIGLFEAHPELSPDVINVSDGGGYLELDAYPIIMEDELYLPVGLVRAKIDKYIFWEEEAKLLTITTPTRVIKITPGEADYSVNDRQLSLALPCIEQNGTAYLPASFTEELYNIEVEYAGSSRLVTIQSLSEDRQLSVISDSTAMRQSDSIKAPILENLKEGALVSVLEVSEDFAKVRSEDGINGYIARTDMGRTTLTAGVEKSEPYVSYPRVTPIDGKINLLFDQVTTVEASAEEWRRTVEPGVNVLAPTWFSFDPARTDGTILDIADPSYTEWAHGEGLKVWGLITDNFDGDMSHAILTNSAVRAEVVERLLGLITKYKLDGINIDFEMVREEDAPYYLQFLRELHPPMKLLGAVLSVDMYVPKPWNLYYNRADVAKSCDYIVVMAYDEHHATSEESGPVASYNFVNEGISATLSEAPKEKILLGVPFYVRIWREVTKNGETTVSSSAYSMENGRKFMEDGGAQFNWLEDERCYYAEYQTAEDGQTVSYKCWLEDYESIEAKLHLMDRAELAGVAGWKRGLETGDIWGLIGEYLAGE